jgi:hypothetical protein
LGLKLYPAIYEILEHSGYVGEKQNLKSLYSAILSCQIQVMAKKTSTVFLSSRSNILLEPSLSSLFASKIGKYF